MLGRWGHRLRRWGNRLRRGGRRPRSIIWYSPAYRLPVPSLASTGFDSRRADSVVAYLLDQGVVSRRVLRVPDPVSYELLALVHSDNWLSAMRQPENLSSVLGVDASEIVADEVMGAIRTACGATVAAVRDGVEGRTSLNLLGGFHHAGLERAWGFCPVNDVAVAIAAVRRDGFAGRIVVLDLDAHPPDGIAECLLGDSRVWVGSLSGSDWGPVPGVDEVRLPAGTGDADYLKGLESLLERMPSAALAIVIAGGDVIEGDLHGGLGLTLEGAQARDLRVLRALNEAPSVWLPGGGYGGHAWRVLAGTATVLEHRRPGPVPATWAPLRLHYAQIARRLHPASLTGDLTEGDVLSDLGLGQTARPRFLGYYTTEGVEHALDRYGILPYLSRLGYGPFRVAIDRDPRGDRLRLLARREGTELLLVELVAEVQRLVGEDYLYIHWLTLRHPRGRFTAGRPQLPGQEVPGLGIARETGELLGRAAHRRGLAGIAFRPAWYHMAYQGYRMGLEFAETRRQARFSAMLRDLIDVPLLTATLAVAEGRVLMNGQPYVWEADLMIQRPSIQPPAIAPSRDRFSLQ